MEPFHEVFDFQNSRSNPPLLLVSQFRELTLHNQEEMEDYLGTLLSADPDFYPLTRPTKLQATQSTPYTPTQFVNTLYPNIKDPSAPPPNLHQSLPANLTTHDEAIFPRPRLPLFSNTSAGLVLAQTLPQTQLQSHQPQISTHKPQILSKTTTVKSCTVNIQLNPTSIRIIRPKPPH